MTEWMKGNEGSRRAAEGGDLGGTMRLGAYEAELGRQQPCRRDLRRDPHQRAPSPPLRSQHAYREVLEQAG
jgi:CTP synthase